MQRTILPRRRASESDYDRLDQRLQKWLNNEYHIEIGAAEVRSIRQRMQLYSKAYAESRKVLSIDQPAGEKTYPNVKIIWLNKVLISWRDVHARIKELARELRIWIPFLSLTRADYLSLDQFVVRKLNELGLDADPIAARVFTGRAQVRHMIYRVETPEDFKLGDTPTGYPFKGPQTIIPSVKFVSWVREWEKTGKKKSMKNPVRSAHDDYLSLV